MRCIVLASTVKTGVSKWEGMIADCSIVERELRIRHDHSFKSAMDVANAEIDLVLSLGRRESRIVGWYL